MTHDWRVGVLPGDGIVARVGTSLVVVGRADEVETQVVERLTEIVEHSAGDHLVRQLARLLLTEDDPPPLAVATVGEDLVSVFLHGDVELIWPDGHARGADHVLGVTETISLTDGFTVALSGLVEPEVAGWSDLGAGTLQGGGLLVASREVSSDTAAEWLPPANDDAPPTVDTPVIDAAPAAGAPDAPRGDADAPRGAPDAPGGDADAPGGDAGDPDHASQADSEDATSDDGGDAPFEAISLTDGVDLSLRAPLPVAQTDIVDDDDRPTYERTVAVIGVFSPRGHFNHPDAKYCSRTGVKMGASMTKVLTEGPRPPLGVLTLDDGATLTVRWNTVIGRDPSVDELVRTGWAAPFVVSDVAQSVSRRHALLELVDWDVYISDLGSRNSTYVQAGPGEPPRQLGIGERLALHSGAVVHLGKRSFVYNEHHVR